jgi:DNA-binding transcriptional LysR family regulator
MELRQLRYFVAVGEEQHYGRAARRLRVAQPALSTQIKNLENEIGFKLFERLSRGVRISAAGQSYLGDCQRILEQVKEATIRAERVARGQLGTLRVGFAESASWHGVVPNSFRTFRERQPHADLQIMSMSSLDQVQAVRSRQLDAGFVFNVPVPESELDHCRVSSHQVLLAAPKGHPLTRVKRLRLRDMADTSFVWFLRRQSPAYYDRLMRACFAGGLGNPRIIQEVLNEATMLSLVSCRLGVAFVTDCSRWRRPEGVVFLPVMDLDVPMILSLVWRRDNDSPLLKKFVSDLREKEDASA